MSTFVLDTSSATILALVGIVGTVVTGLFKLLNDNTKATNALVAETKKGNEEAKERNGHLGEQNVQIATLVTAQTPTLASILEAVKSASPISVHTDAITVTGGSKEDSK